MEIEKIKSIIEAILFAAGREVKEEELVLSLEISKEQIEEIIRSMQEDYKSRGIEIIKIDNLKFLLNSPIGVKGTQNIEKVYTYIKTHHEKYKTIEIEKLYITNINDTTLVLVLSDDEFEIFKMDILDDKIDCAKVALSETYSVFNSSNVSYSNKTYKNQETESTKLFGIF